MLTLAVTGALGGLVATILALIARSQVAPLAGLVALFPTFALFAHVLTFQAGGATQVRLAALFGLAALLPYAGYLLAVAATVEQIGLARSLAAALAAWLVMAVLSVALWNLLIGPALESDRPERQDAAAALDALLDADPPAIRMATRLDASLQVSTQLRPAPRQTRSI